jgi:hypothetical protein
VQLQPCSSSKVNTASSVSAVRLSYQRQQRRITEPDEAKLSQRLPLSGSKTARSRVTDLADNDNVAAVAVVCSLNADHLLRKFFMQHREF